MGAFKRNLLNEVLLKDQSFLFLLYISIDPNKLYDPE